MDETCLWDVRIKGGEDLSCGKRATSKVRIKGRLGSGLVPVCAEHKAKHDQNAADLRSSIRERQLGKSRR